MNLWNKWVKLSVSVVVLLLLSAVASEVFSSKPSKEETTQLSSGLPVQALDLSETIIDNVKDIKRLKINRDRTLFLNTEVDNQSVEMLVGVLAELNAKNSTEPIRLLLDSPGGSVFDGARLISFIESSKAPVDTIVYSTCASMCAHIHAHGKHRYMIDRSVVMYHPAAGGLSGKIEEMASVLKFVTLEIDKLDAFIADRSGLDRGTFKKMTRDELWLTADEALRLNLTDSLVTLDIDAKDANSLAILDIAEVRKAHKNSPNVISTTDKLNQLKSFR